MVRMVHVSLLTHLDNILNATSSICTSQYMCDYSIDLLINIQVDVSWLTYVCFWCIDAKFIFQIVEFLDIMAVDLPLLCFTYYHYLSQ